MESKASRHFRLDPYACAAAGPEDEQTAARAAPSTTKALSQSRFRPGEVSAYSFSGVRIQWTWSQITAARNIEPTAKAEVPLQRSSCLSHRAPIRPRACRAGLGIGRLRGNGPERELKLPTGAPFLLGLILPAEVYTQEMPVG